MRPRAASNLALCVATAALLAASSPVRAAASDGAPAQPAEPPDPATPAGPTGQEPPQSGPAEPPAPATDLPPQPVAPPPPAVPVAPPAPELPVTPPPTAPVTPPPPPASPAPAAPETAGLAPEESWIDVGHAFVEQRMFAPVLRLDRFFSDERALEAERARSFVRYRNNLRFRDDGTPTYTMDLAANLRLPGLNHSLERLRLVIEAQTEEAVNAILPEGPASALGGGLGHAEGGVRYGAWEGRHSSVDLGTGVLMQLPVGVFGRVRYRASIPVRRVLLLRLATSGFWRTDTRFGTSIEAGAERPLGSSSVVRLGGASLLTERSRGIEWSSELAYVLTLTPRSAIALAGALEGAQRSPVAVDKYRIYARYRRDVFRHWIYGELEPEVAWPWSADRGRFRELAITVRMEIQFHGNEPPVPPPAERRREPADPPALAPARLR